MAGPVTNADTPAGFGFAVSAYLMWGFLPLYMKALAHIPPIEIVAHRIIWSVPVAALILWATGRTGDLGRVISSPRTLAMAGITAALISVNWGVYVWAIGAGYALDAALGYYINPLFSVFLGAVLLKERLSRTQIAAILLAATAVVLLAVESGRVPVAALALTFSWGAYAYCKKSLPIGPNQGFLLEVLILTPIALAVVATIWFCGESAFFTHSTADGWLLLGTGLVTAVPLILFAYGAKRLKLTTIGFLQYIAPTMIFLMAVLVFGEEFGRAQSIAFPMIWAALVLYTISLVREARGSRKARA